jgi:hypothetical protein
MTDQEAAELRRQCDYLKQRNAQLQRDTTDLSAEVERLRSVLERAANRRASHVPNPLGSGQ